MQNIETLKSLTQTTFDSVEGYRKAAEKAESSGLKNALERRMTDRMITLETLNSTLEKNGEERINSVSTSASAHQMFLNITDSFSGGDEAAAKRVEEGEDYLAGQFRDALNDDDLDGSIRQVITQTSREVMDAERFSDTLEAQYA